MTGIPWLDVFVIAGIIATGLGLLALLGKVVRWMLRTWKRIADFLDDWNGEPARPGVEARLGFPERIASLERTVSNGLSANVKDIQRRVIRLEEGNAALLDARREER